jgi:hypothetical protein
MAWTSRTQIRDGRTVDDVYLGKEYSDALLRLHDSQPNESGAQS